MRLPHFRFPQNPFSGYGLAVIGAGAALLIAGVTYFIQQDQQKIAINKQTDTTNQLILQVKSLSEQNKNLNEQNRNYAYCNAVILAKYTQDQQPITIEDLNKCIFTSFPRNSGPGVTTQSNAQTFLSPQSPSSTRMQPATTNPQQAPPSTNNQPPNQIVDVPNLLELNTPCINVLGLIMTCK